MKRNDELSDLINSKTNGGMLLDEEWKLIIYYLYEENDAKLIEAKIIDEINMQLQLKIRSQISKTKMSRDELAGLNRIQETKNISYNIFLKIILDFQIKSRVNFLRKFTNLFRSVDTDNNGIISENEFLTLLNTVSYQNKINLEPIVARLLNNLDPFNNKQINYSDCIYNFSKENIKLNEQGSADTLLNIIVGDN